jgi:hypothetical protein
MRLINIAAVFLSILAVASAALADEAWLLTYDEAHRQVVVKADDQGMRTVSVLAGDPIFHGIIYGETAETLGIISRPGTSRSFVLKVFDKQAGGTLYTWPVGPNVEARILTPTKDLVLTKEAAFFLRSTPEGQDTRASFEWMKLTLRDGSLSGIALPREFVAPRLLEFSGSVLISCLSADSLWRYDLATGRCGDALPSAELRALFNQDVDRSGLLVLPQFIGIPGAGVSRLSKSGLQRVMSPNLASLDRSQQPQRLPFGQGSIARVFGSTFEGAAAVGVVRTTPRAEQWLFAYLDAASQRVRWEIELPWGAADVMPVGKDHIVYLDLAKAVVVKRSRNETLRLWTLLPAPNGVLTGTRIMSFQ